MSKLRSGPPAVTVKSHFHTTAVKVDGMSWCFSTEGFAWKYEDRGVENGHNLGMYQPTGDYSFQLTAKTLDDAVMYAWGFTMGWKARKATYESETKDATKE